MDLPGTGNICVILATECVLLLLASSLLLVLPLLLLLVQCTDN